ncbi:MAG: ISKra4 family transposase [Planctomycetota bacterium]|nr:ISKra4 family transposase [Planctomycetota bacterium]MDA1161876.1 ISKra4 family transposase [Planctomycetota bacterium]
MVLSLETRIKVHQNVDRMLEWFDQSLACELRLDEMEPQVFAEGMSLLRSMLQDGIDDLVQQVEQSAPERIERTDGPDLVPVEKKPRRLVTVFGELRIGGPGYAVREKQKVEYAPVDQRLGLPEGEFSYLFQNWCGRFFVRNAYGDASTSLVDLLGVKVSVDSLESMNLRMAADVEAFREQQTAPPAKEEGELLVLSADATGVPMANRGGKMQMAYIGAAYTVDRFVRTADDVLDEVLRKQSQKGRPRPQFKRLHADMTRSDPDDSAVTLDGRVGVFSWLAHERQTRAASGSQPRPVICLMDGEHKLWERKDQLLGEDVVEILDFWHFLERLREVSKLLSDTAAAAEAFVKERLARVLDGDLGRVIGGLRQMLKKRRLSKKSQATIQSAITYFENNRSRMRYGDYLREGYPIASGIIEGSCRLVVEDRLDRTGMRWSLDGALAMLANRTTSLSDDWNDYETFRITREQKRLYPAAT